MRYGLIAALLLLLIYQIVGTPVKGLFYPEKSKSFIDFIEKTEDIRQADLNELIKKETEAGNFNKATRYLYIKLLKTLDEIQLINWQTGKTNRDYYYELSGKEVQQEFSFLTFLYEYIWYGEFGIEKNRFEEVNERFISMFKLLELNKNRN